MDGSHADPRDIAENAVVSIDLGELLGILENFRRNCDVHFTRASLVIAEKFHLGDREE